MCIVDDDDFQLEEEDFYSSADIIHESTPPLPIQPPPPSQHRQLHERRSPQPVPLAVSLRNLSQQPPTGIKPWLSQNDMPTAVTSSEDLDNNYHFLEQENNNLNTMERNGYGDFVQGYYDLGVDDDTLYDMNKNPPPVWRPEDSNLPAPPPLPPNRPHGFSELDANTSKLQLRTPILPKQTQDHGIPHPPPKPQSELSGSATFSPRMKLPSMFNFKDDPRFNKKLEEKRQELYGSNGVILRGRSISLNEVDDISQEFYESINDSHEAKAPLTLRVTSLHDDYSEAIADPIDYLEFESSMSGNNSRAGSLPPDLPPKTDSMQREISGLMHASPHNSFPLPARVAHPTVRSGHMPPPLLPSREQINPTQEPAPSSSVSQQPPSVTDDEDTPPPVPVRLSSNRSYPSLQEPPVFLGRSRSPDHRPTIAQDQLPQASSNFSQVLTDMLSSNVNRRMESSSPRPMSSPVDQGDFEISSEIYDDIHAVKTPQEEACLSMSYDDIVTSPPPLEPRRNQHAATDMHVARSYNDVFNNEPERSWPINEVPATMATSCEGKSTTDTEKALLQSLESKFHSRSSDSTDPVLPPPVKPKTSPEKKPKPRRFHAPPTKPKPAKSSQFPRVQQRTEQVIHSAPTSPKRVLSDPGLADVEEFGPDRRIPIVPMKPKPNKKPLVPSKPGLSDKLNVAIKPATNSRLPNNNKQKQLNSPGENQKEPLKQNVLNKPVPKEKPRVVQRSKLEDLQEGQKSAISATSIAPRTGPPPIGARTGPPPAARNGPLLLPVPARAAHSLSSVENQSSSENKGQLSATGRTGVVSTASRTRPPPTANRTGSPPTASRTGPPTTANRTGPPTTASRTGPPTTANRTGPPTTANRTGPPTTANRTGPPTTANRTGPPTTANRTGPPTTANRTGPPTTANRTGPPTTANRTGPPTTANRTGPPTTANRTGPPTTANRTGLPPTAGRTGPPLTQPKPPKAVTTMTQPPSMTPSEPWQRPPVPIPSTTKPPPVRPKPTQVAGKPPLQTPLCS